ncbi:hypothetical protein H4Q32_011403 [Labeo rohita]|uniref:Reverse transcriptase n=1 Tax=Labeo rohita TaxID=84645 RepID=A0ABQ8LVG7_LABRO|nr:hypothetical protein H4Q32_011403 [Labeo rohita]
MPKIWFIELNNPARGSLEHILSCCPKALGEGRYRWRHDQVLKAVADTICAGIQQIKHQPLARPYIVFVRAGEKPQSQPKVPGDLLSTAGNWQLKVDLGRQLKFPDHITSTTLRPDMVLTSESTKQVVLLELTVPWEDRIEEAFERKKAKYLELVEDCRRKGWRARCEPIEVGCREFPGQSLHRSLRLLGIRSAQERKATRNICEAAEKASRWLWIKRGDVWLSALLGHKSGSDHPRLGRPELRLITQLQPVTSKMGESRRREQGICPQFQTQSMLHFDVHIDNNLFNSAVLPRRSLPEGLLRPVWCLYLYLLFPSLSIRELPQSNPLAAKSWVLHIKDDPSLEEST